MNTLKLLQVTKYKNIQLHLSASLSLQESDTAVLQV